VKRILLDTDLAMGAPGSDIDDGFALALAVADPEIEVELVTTVGGNSDVDTSTRLTEELLARIGRADIPVLRGAGIPFAPRWRHPRKLEQQPPAMQTRPTIRSQHGAVALVERVMAEPGELTLVAIGPLTNIALALMLEPRIAGAVAGIVVMGGVYLEPTNVSSMPGEYNFWCDPDAASIVLASGAPLRFVGLDVTQQVRLSRADTAAMAATGKQFAPFAAACADGWIDHQERVKLRDEREHGSCALHDPLAVAVVTHPDLVTWQPAHVAVETTNPLTRGVAIADLLRWENPPEPNCEIAVAVDAEAFRAHFLGLMTSLP
jgi:purine nucleosidase